MAILFISHSRKDRSRAEAMRDWLFGQNHRSLFLDSDPEKGLTPGQRWEDELYQRLRQCRAVLALVTPDWLASKWCFAEVTQARASGKPALLAKVAPCVDDGLFSDTQHVDLVTDPEAGYRALAQGLRKVGIDPIEAFDWDGSWPPYPGLSYFDEKDAAIFFGRDADIQKGLERLESLRRAGETPFLLLLGASGSGKSSLMRAGLLARRRKEPQHWLPIPPFRPLSDPCRHRLS